jgi:hypothetical protein
LEQLESKYATRLPPAHRILSFVASQRVLSVGDWLRLYDDAVAFDPSGEEVLPLQPRVAYL